MQIHQIKGLNVFFLNNLLKEVVNCKKLCKNLPPKLVGTSLAEKRKFAKFLPSVTFVLVVTKV